MRYWVEIDQLDERPFPLLVEAVHGQSFPWVMAGGILVAARYPVRSSYYYLEAIPLIPAMFL